MILVGAEKARRSRDYLLLGARTLQLVLGSVRCTHFCKTFWSDGGGNHAGVAKMHYNGFVAQMSNFLRLLLPGGSARCTLSLQRYQRSVIVSLPFIAALLSAADDVFIPAV